MKAFFITGKPACGKDTQAEFLAKKFGLTKITTSSDLLREFFRQTAKNKKLKLGHKVIDLERQRRIFQAGGLVAAQIVTNLVCQKIKLLSKRKISFVMAGSPRKLSEGRAELALLKKTYGEGNYFFIYLKISDREAIRRALLRPYTDKRRSDKLDVLPIVKKRLVDFRQDVVPLLRYLRKKGKLIEVNGEQSKQKVFREILEKISSR
jgi:adenylate kinase